MLLLRDPGGCCRRRGFGRLVVAWGIWSEWVSELRTWADRKRWDERVIDVSYADVQ